MTNHIKNFELDFETGGKDAARTRTQGCVRYVAQASQPAGSRSFPAPCFSRRAKPGASTLAACRNIPCTPAVSLLKLFPSAANRTTYRNPVCVRPLFRASPCFEKTQNKAFGFTLKRNQLVGVRRVATPIETTVFDLMARLIGRQKTNLPRRFLRENAGAKTPNTILTLKGRTQRQENE